MTIGVGVLLTTPVEHQEEGSHSGQVPVQRDDDQIRVNVETVLAEDSWLDASEISVNVTGGVVTLTGTVESREAKRRAEDLAGQILGVKDVQNNLKVRGL